jgi:hypothetical protein
MIAIHANFLGGHDSNAGHSTVFGLQNSATGKYSYNSDAGNMLLYTLWNPYLGKKKADGTVGATYWQAGLDAQFRAPVGDTALSLQVQATVAQFYAYFAPVTINGEVVGEGSINIGGGLVSAAIGHEPWQIAARFAVVVPDNAFTAGGGPITGSDPILELTLPSITFHLNENAKLVADAIWMIDTPYRVADNGTILLAEMPSQAGSTPGTNLRTDLAPVGRMMFQYTY